MEPTEIENLRAENKILRAALAEAAQFAMVRCHHDARELNATAESFQARWMTDGAEHVANAITEAIANGR